VHALGERGFEDGKARCTHAIKPAGPGRERPGGKGVCHYEGTHLEKVAPVRRGRACPVGPAAGCEWPLFEFRVALRTAHRGWQAPAGNLSAGAVLGLGGDRRPLRRWPAGSHLPRPLGGGHGVACGFRNLDLPQDPSPYEEPLMPRAGAATRRTAHGSSGNGELQPWHDRRRP